jgi:mannose-6-phosphate isomerase class I
MTAGECLSLQLPIDVPSYCMKALDCASIVIVMQGHGTADSASLAGHAISIKRGTVFFVSAYEEVVITVSSSNDGMLMFRAFYT